MPAVTAQALTDAAVALGYDALSYRLLLECLLYATTQASGGGGGGGIGEVLTGTVDPTTAPTSPSAGALYYNRTTGVIWQWNPDPGTLAWE